MVDVTIPDLIRFQAATGVAVPEGVAGIALPLETEVDRPGIAIDDAGNLAFFDVKLYDRNAFDWQLLDLNDGKRPFMWEHGAVGGQASLTTVPIGTVLSMLATDDEMRFIATFNETTVARQIKQVVGDGVVREVSAAIQTLSFTIEKKDNRTVQRITRADFKHVSLVVHAEFPEAKLVSVFCDQCSARPALETASVERERNARNGEVEQKLWAHINSLQHQLEMARLGKETA